MVIIWISKHLKIASKIRVSQNSDAYSINLPVVNYEKNETNY